MIPWQRWAQSASECPIRAIFILEGWSLMLLKEGLSWVCIFLLSPVLANWIQECLAAQAALCNNHPPGPTWAPCLTQQGQKSHFLWPLGSAHIPGYGLPEFLPVLRTFLIQNHEAEDAASSLKPIRDNECASLVQCSGQPTVLVQSFLCPRIFLSTLPGFITYSVLCTPSSVWWSPFRKKKTLEIANQLYWNTPFKISLEYILRCTFLLRHSISRCHGRSNNYQDFKVEMGINDILRHVMTVMLKENACGFYWR